MFETDSSQPVKPRATSQHAQKNAEALFQSRNIAGIKEVERQTRRDVEAKKQELRKLVGDSYHELIHIADVVVDMAASAKTVTENIAHIQSVFNGLAVTLAVPGSQRDVSSGLSAEQSELYALGSRVKYLLDTPEAVWGYLDGSQPLAAARRHLRAECVYECLERSQRPTLPKRFPLLKAQYPAIRSQKHDISARVHELLASSTDLAPLKLARALATLCLLDGSSSEAALALFLQSRRDCVLTELRAASGSRDLAGLAAALVRAMHRVQDTVRQATLLFMERHASMSAAGGLRGLSMVQDAACEDQHSASELMFDALPPPPAGGDARTEIAAWRETTAALEARIRPLAVDDTGRLCTEWLKALSAAVADAADALLAPTAACAELVDLEAAAARAVRDWTGAAADGSRDSDDAPRWDDVADAALGRRTTLWPEVLEAAFVARASSLVQQRFAAAVEAVKAPLRECVGRVGASDGDQAGAVAPAAEAWRQRVCEVAHALDDALRGVLEDVLTLLPKGGGGGGALARTRSLLPSAAVADRRAATLQAHAQECLARSARDLAGMLGDDLAALPPATSSGVVEQALVLGRLAELVGEDSSSLALILGPPDHWGVLSSAGRLGPAQSQAAAHRHARTHRAASAARLEPISAAMHAVSRQAFGVWSRWACTGLSDAFVAGLLHEGALRARVVPPNWEEVVVESPDEASSMDAVAIRFCLPAQPTTVTLRLLMHSCNELQRAGGANVARGALLALTYDLQVCVLRQLQDVLSPAGTLTSVLSEKGVLQLLFDLRCVRDALAGGRPPDADASASAAAVGALRAEWAQLEGALCMMLDPIDWATYEPYLWAGQTRCMQQKSLVFGLLMQQNPGHELQLDKLHGQAVKQGSFLDMGPSCKHLPLLPIAMPAVQPAAQALTTGPMSPRNGNATSLTALQPQLKPARDANTAPATDLVEAYSFASLTVHRPAAESMGASTPEAGGMAAAAMSTFESLGARFTDSTAALGSMGISLDVSAMQHLLQPTVLSSSLFNFGSK